MTKIAISITLTLVTLLILARLLFPYGVQYGFSHFFAAHNINVQIHDVTLNLIDREIQVTGVSTEKDSTQLLSLTQMSIQWSWSDLKEHQVYIPLIQIDGLTFAIDQKENGDLIIAGLDITKLTAADATKPLPVKTEHNSPSDWIIHIGDLVLNDFEICYKQKSDKNLNYCSSFNQMTWLGDIQYNLAKITDTVIPISLSGDYSLTGLKLHNNNLNRTLLSLNNFEINTLNINTPKSINIEKITLNNFSLLERTSDTLDNQMTRFDSLTINKINLSNLDKLQIDTISIINHELLFIVNKDKTMEFNDWLPTQKNTNTSQEKPKTKSSNEPYKLVLNKFTYDSNKHIQFIDKSLVEPFTVALRDITLSIDTINTSKPEQLSGLMYTATHDKHGKIEFQGTLTPLAEKPSFDLTGNLTGIDLRSVSAFTKDAIGHSIKSGQLDMGMKLFAKKSVLDSEFKLSLFHFELKALSNEDAKKLDSGLGFPLNTSLMLLKDKDNSINLTIPVTGDLKNPNFDPNDVITTALSKAITSAILNFYTPYGIADTLISLATALRFNPVAFKAGSTELGYDEKNAIEKISALMIERPNIHITLCGFTNKADRLNLTKHEQKDKMQEFQLSDNDRDNLSNLTASRYNIIKKTMVNAKVNVSRLVSCESEHDEDNEFTGVEISI